MRDHSRDRNVLCLDYMNFDIPVVILHCSFARDYIRQKLKRAHRNSLYYFYKKFNKKEKNLRKRGNPIL